MADIITINDDNYRQFVSPVVNGERKRCRSYGMWTPGRPLSAGVPFAESGIPLIPESEWDDRLAQTRKDNATLKEFNQALGLQPLDQNGTNYCWANGVVQCAQIMRLQQTGQYIHLSPASVAGPKTSYRNVGGWGDMALEGMVERGCNTAEEWPPNAIDRKYDTAPLRERAKRNTPLEYAIVDDFQQTASAIIAGYPVAVGFNWWSDLVCGVGIREGNHDLLILNSWGNWSDAGYGWLQGSKKKPDGAVAIMSMQTI